MLPRDPPLAAVGLVSTADIDILHTLSRIATDPGRGSRHLLRIDATRGTPDGHLLFALL